MQSTSLVDFDPNTDDEIRAVFILGDTGLESIRFWLDLDDDDPMPSPTEAERLFISELERINAVYLATLISNSRALATGGMTTDYTFLTCYADYTVRGYVLGSGPTRLTVAYDRLGKSRSYETYRLAREAGEFGSEALMTEAEYADWQSQLLFDIARGPSADWRDNGLGSGQAGMA